jgi:prevent-host-death family protein
MREIGVRELKATLSDVLRHVARGERVRVTVRNRAVADIVPVGAEGPDERMHELVTQRRLVLPARPKPERAPRLAHAKTSASAIVLAERDEDR